MKQIIYYISCIAMMVLLVRCASQQPITGGPQDETPPKLLNSIPKNQSINFQGNTITLEFDEYLKVDNLKKELLISPRTTVKYSYKLKKGTILEIKFDSALDANTTYTLNFRESVKDFNEGNPAENLKLAFSTGDYIDSLRISGKVTDLMTGLPKKDATVMLFTSKDSVTLPSGNPLYITQTTENGEYVIENLRNDDFQVFVLDDSDGNLKYTKRGEALGFYPEVVKLDSNRQGIDMKMTGYDYEKFRVNYMRPTDQYFDIQFNKGVASFDLKFSDPEMGEKIFVKQLNDKLRLFNPLAEKDSMEISLQAQDSVGNTLDTTRYISFRIPKKPKESEFTVTATPKSDAYFEVGSELELLLNFNKPLAAFQEDKFFQIVAVTDTTQDTIRWEFTPKMSDLQDQLMFPKSEYKGAMSLFFEKGAFVSVENDTAKSVTISYNTYDVENYGVVYGTVETWQDNFVIQLMQNGKVEQEVWNQKNYRFEYVLPGTKTIRILVDENGNGTFDVGDYKTKTLPEKVIFYEKELPVKANWEVEADPIKF